FALRGVHSGPRIGIDDRRGSLILRDTSRFSEQFLQAHRSRDMPSYTTSQIRNVLIAGHGGSGKTTLIDALLFASGTVKHKGSVGDGSSLSDFEKEEKEHGHSIYASVLHADHQGCRINFIDAPGS